MNPSTRRIAPQRAPRQTPPPEAETQPGDEPPDSAYPSSHITGSVALALVVGGANALRRKVAEYLEQRRRH